MPDLGITIVAPRSWYQDLGTKSFVSGTCVVLTGLCNKMLAKMSAIRLPIDRLGRRLLGGMDKLQKTWASRFCLHRDLLDVCLVPTLTTLTESGGKVEARLYRSESGALSDPQ